MSEAPLSDLLVIDLSQGVAGAFCCLLFRRCGAEVIKAEPPAGDPTRAAGPHPETSALFFYLNAGKKGVTLDIAHPEGALLLRRLAEEADILVDDSPSGRLAALGLGYEELSRANPRLVVTSVTAVALSGFQPNGGHQADYLVGLNAFTATMIPLVNLAVHGQGQHIDVSGSECLAATSLCLDDGAAFPAFDLPPTDDRRRFEEIEHAVAGRLDLPAAPFRLDGIAPLSPAPLLGEHNEDVYCSLLALTAEELAGLRSAGAI
ncbi:MAG: CoA transferase [Dehalococcoidia bacterium]|jgi:crotonobetainyl-CoA:carnitine CoA-transferase CaiB-like acyl-CoA transferase